VLCEPSVAERERSAAAARNHRAAAFPPPPAAWSGCLVGGVRDSDRAHHPARFAADDESERRGRSSLGLVPGKPLGAGYGSAAVRRRTRGHQHVMHGPHLQFLRMRLGTRAAERDRTDERQPTELKHLLEATASRRYA